MGIALRPPVASVDRTMRVPPATAWQVLVDVEQWPRWGPSVRRATLDDGGSELSAGAQGTVWTAVGVPLRFSITDFDPGHRWAWTVAGVAATGHEVIGVAEGCRVRFDVPWWAAAYLPVCAVALTRIEALATSG
ncbi:MAG: SRPBCC family protein [Mycobacteriaceae bacterium]